MQRVYQHDWPGWWGYEWDGTAAGRGGSVFCFGSGFARWQISRVGEPSSRCTLHENPAGALQHVNTNYKMGARSLLAATGAD